MLRTVFTRRVVSRGAGFKNFKNLIPAQRFLSTAAQNNVLRGYLEYWDHIRFRKGWAKPQFESEEVRGLLEDAAEHSAAVYEYLDEKSTEPRLRKRGGESIAFLSGVQYDPNEHPERFVRELVHSTLSDASGYVEGLTTEKIDEIMATRCKHRVIITKLENLREELLWSTYVTKDKAGSLIEEAIKTLKMEQKKEEQLEEENTEQKVSINVTSHVQSVKDLVDKTDIRWEKVKEDPSHYNEELKVLQEKCAESTSVLMKDLLALQQEVQSSVAEGNPANEEVKEEIVKIHSMLETVDEVSKRIQVLKTATENEMSKKKEEEKEQAKNQEREKMIKEINTWVQGLVQTMSKPTTWQNITMKPDFNERTRRGYSLISTYLPRLDPSTCEVNVNNDVLMITGTCLPTKEDIEATISPLIHTLAKNPMSATPLLQRNHQEFADYLSQGKWGVFTKYYTLPTRLPSDAVRAHYADSVLSIAVPFMV